MANSADAVSTQTIVYISEKHGSDENGDGSEGKPFKTPLQAYRKHGDNLTVYIDGKDETKNKWRLILKNQSKKLKTRYEEEKRNEKAKAERQEKERPQREKNVEEARKIIITEDTSLPTAKAVR
ncbi:unnamed protein product [Adineta steineri]|uniref:Asparagine--tRNA ligase N-terminal domain-containing protein n=1 Tax=Adineta steineri TaxID=433720 RepID=A0A819HUX0_9BILA|nr:unnamed protein product [Adineta steineri]CAF3903212.1 unnamed protein product [Adineta steineri]